VLAGWFGLVWLCGSICSFIVLHFQLGWTTLERKWASSLLTFTVLHVGGGGARERRRQLAQVEAGPGRRLDAEVAQEIRHWDALARLVEQVQHAVACSNALGRHGIIRDLCSPKEIVQSHRAAQQQKMK